MVLLCQAVVLLECVFVILASLMSVQKGRASKLFCHCALINGKNTLPLPTLKLANIGSTRCKTLKKVLRFTR